MEVSRAVLNYLRGKTNVYTNPFSCLCLPLCCTEQKRSVSEREAWEILDERKEEENSLKFSDKKRELCSVFTCMCVCVCLYLKKKIVVQSKREGWDIVLLSSYFLLSCVCLWKGGGHKKKGRKRIDILTLQHVILPHTLYGFWWTAIKFFFLSSLFPGRQWVRSVFVNLAFLLVADSDISTSLVSLPAFVLVEWWVSSG